MSIMGAAKKGFGILGKAKKFLNTDPKVIQKPVKDPDVIKLNKQIKTLKNVGKGTVGAVIAASIAGKIKNKKGKK